MRWPTARSSIEGSWRRGPSERLQILHQILLLRLAQPQLALAVVVVHDVEQRRETAIMIEPAGAVKQPARERGRAIPVVRRAARLEVVDAHLLSRMQVPTGLGERRRHMAGGALALTVEDNLAARRGDRIERARWRRGRGQRELVEVQGRQLG